MSEGITGVVNVYYDSDGHKCSLNKLVKLEPEWAANRIRGGEAVQQENAALRTEIHALRAHSLHIEGMVKQIAVQFFYHWWNTPGNNTEQGFDEWYENNKFFIQTPAQSLHDVKMETAEKVLDKCEQLSRYYVERQNYPEWGCASEYEKGVIITSENIADAIRNLDLSEVIKGEE